MQIEGKIAIVTGASSGLGAAITHSLIVQGAIVYGLARNKEELFLMKTQYGNSFNPVVLDITNQSAVKYWVKRTFKDDYSPDILINNAGIGTFGKIDEMPSELWLQMINTNINGMYHVTSAIVPFLKKKETSTHIINIGSILANMGHQEGSAYCTSKYGVQGFSDALCLELRYFNIKVTCINPGSIETDFFKSSGIEAHANMLHAKDLADTVVYVLSTPDNMLINEMTIRPLSPKKQINYG